MLGTHDHHQQARPENIHSFSPGTCCFTYHPEAEEEDEELLSPQSDDAAELDEEEESSLHNITTAISQATNVPYSSHSHGCHRIHRTVSY